MQVNTKEILLNHPSKGLAQCAMVNMGGRSQTELSTPPIGFQCTPLHLGCGFTYRAIQYNSVNVDDMWKGIVN